MALGAFLISVGVSLVSGLLVWLTKLTLPAFSALWRGWSPLLVGDTVSWSTGNFCVLERKGSRFNYQYKLVNIIGVSPWRLLMLSSNPQLAGDAAVIWYKGSRGRCYLKKTGHPRLELKVPVLSASAYPAR
jgi:hypothetical protein